MVKATKTRTQLRRSTNPTTWKTRCVTLHQASEQAFACAHLSCGASPSPAAPPRRSGRLPIASAWRTVIGAGSPDSPVPLARRLARPAGSPRAWASLNNNSHNGARQQCAQRRWTAHQFSQVEQTTVKQRKPGPTLGSWQTIADTEAPKDSGAPGATNSSELLSSSCIHGGRQTDAYHAAQTTPEQGGGYTLWGLKVHNGDARRGLVCRSASGGTSSGSGARSCARMELGCAGIMGRSRMGS